LEREPVLSEATKRTTEHADFVQGGKQHRAVLPGPKSALTTIPLFITIAAAKDGESGS
jgi:hypothetical protein